MGPPPLPPYLPALPHFCDPPARSCCPPALPCGEQTTFPTFIKRFGFFSFHWEVAESYSSFFPRLNSEVYLYHSEIFLVSKVDFGIFPKISIVSWILYFFDKINSLYVFKGVSQVLKETQVFLEGFEPCQAPPF